MSTSSNPRRRPTTTTTTLAVASLAIAGCAPTVTVAGEVTELTWGPWVHTLTLLAPILFAIVAGLLLPRPGKWVYGGLAALAAVLASLVMLVAWTSKITVTASELYDHAGFPWARIRRGFLLADVQHVYAYERVEHSYRSVKRQHVWKLAFVDGRREELIVGDLWKAARPELFERLRRAGVLCSAAGEEAPSDPFLVSVPGAGPTRVDAESASERLGALVLGGFAARLVRDGGAEQLNSALRAGAPLVGLWSLELVGEIRSARLALTLGEDGTFRYDLVEGAGTSSVAGTYRVVGRELVLEHAGVIHSLLVGEG